ncbi:MAG: HAMP domain-containing protein [Rhizobiales bacterium]|nr:HAMP domain-containing protein [Hyphomicrobiales bacterium]
MADDSNEAWFRRGGLFAKYVVSLVGLVLFVLAINAALETWMIYRETRASLTATMSDKAEAAARRIAQSMSDLERQVSWVTRASVATIEQRQADYAQLLNQQPSVRQIFKLDGAGREQLRMTRAKVTLDSGANFSRDLAFTQGVAKGATFAPATFRDGQPFMEIAVAHSGQDAGVTVAEIDLRFLGDFVDAAQAGKHTTAYIVDPNGRVLAHSGTARMIGQDWAALPQVAALLKPDGTPLDAGTARDGHSVLTAAHVVPKLGWFVVFEQPTSQALAPVRDLLLRIAALAALGLAVATLAGILLARRMVGPINALRAGARRLGAGDFGHRIEVKTSDELEELADQFNSMAGQLQETYAGLESKVAERTRDLARSVDELATARDTVQRQADKLQEQTDQLQHWNRSLEERVEKQLGEIERIRRLERFLAPQVAQLIASSDGHDSLLNSHRREVTVVFCDLRGFTAFTESSEPEEAMNVLREYHAALGELIFRYEGTLDRYAGDGVMILFNAPLPFPDHAERAVRMAIEMRDNIEVLARKWRNRGHNLGFGVGIAVGYATLGQIGFEQRLEYAAIGSVTNLASRLSDEARAGQIIVSQRAYGMVESLVEARPIEPLNLKGFHHPVAVVEILRWRGSQSGADTAAQQSSPAS